MTLIQCFDPTLSCLDTKIWWTYHPDSPWRIEAVAVVSFCVFDGSMFQVPTSPCFSQSKVFHSRAFLEKKNIHRGFLSEQLPLWRSKFRSLKLQKTGNLAPNFLDGELLELHSFCRQALLRPRRMVERSFSHLGNGWGRWLVQSYQYHSQHGSLETPIRFWGKPLVNGLEANCIYLVILNSERMGFFGFVFFSLWVDFVVMIFLFTRRLATKDFMRKRRVFCG